MAVKTTVQIMNKEYIIKGDDSEAHILRVAAYVDEKMAMLHDANNHLDNIKLAVLTAVNIADEYIKTKEQLDACRKELARYRRGSSVK